MPQSMMILEEDEKCDASPYISWMRLLLQLQKGSVEALTDSPEHQRTANVNLRVVLALIVTKPTQKQAQAFN